METIKFKTNIKCTGCIARAAAILNQEQKIEKWEVDILSPDKILTIKTDGMTSQEIIETVRKAGFEAEPVKN
jgi:copper chaperone